MAEVQESATTSAALDEEPEPEGEIDIQVLPYLLLYQNRFLMSRSLFNV